MRISCLLAQSPLEIPHHPAPRTEVSQSPSFVFERMAALIVTSVIASGVLLALWFDTSRPTAMPSTYPYYDTQKPVPPWSEPTPLAGNR
jgi:hypothetical protein